MEPGTRYLLEVNPTIPDRLTRIEELANNLWYSWDRPTRDMFARLHPGLWTHVGHSPKAFLKRIDEERLVEAASDPVFLNTYNQVLSAFDTYHEELTRSEEASRLAPDDLVAYFCFEFGFHESMPIYSGGLGILAGDHCKAASDMRLPFVAVGLLYRQGYFFQTIDADGSQHSIHNDADYEDLPVELVLDAEGRERRVSVDVRGRGVQLRIWRVKVGHIELLLLDSDIPENAEHDRAICHRLYGGDRATRIEQEIVLGVGGVRALAAVGLKPTVWHMNEGHAAFLVLERIRELMREGLDFGAALEAVAVNTVFTTHTAVAAGHDHFAAEMINQYFEHFCRELDIAPNALFALGHVDGSPDFNMTALAVRGSRHQNGVSAIHRDVTAKLLRDLWPQIEPEESPVTHVTNGVHVPTFLSPEWADVFDRYFGPGWTQNLLDRRMWDTIADLPDHILWSMHQYLKSQMLRLVRQRFEHAHFRNQGSEAHLDRLLRLADPANPNVLTIGFARRFATYKRASLLFTDLEWLKQIVSDEERPVLFIFAGKAHPADAPGQDLIRRVAQVARMPEFEGRILLVEGYDLRLGRRMVGGVDVWLNNPVYPLEASGTSGMKAGMNGVLNLSVLDGWWGEGYTGDNGWAIKPATDGQDGHRRDLEEARTLYEILQDQVIPLYYARGPFGYSPGWVKMKKRSIATILPQYNSLRMLGEYISKFYVPASVQGKRYAEGEHRGARSLAQWKSRVHQAWQGVALRRVDAPVSRIRFGSSIQVEVEIALNGLAPSDVVVELVLKRAREAISHRLKTDGRIDAGGHCRFTIELAPEVCGRLSYRIRAFPHHPLLTHPLEMGLMKWA
jgi:starch phosphorylase